MNTPNSAEASHRQLTTLDWGLCPYNQALQAQEELWVKVWQAQQLKIAPLSGYLIATQHPNVITCGRRENGESLRVAPEILRHHAVEVIKIGRGGQATLHSPGQLVVYGILPLHAWRMSIKCFVANMEKAMVATCQSYGINAVAGFANGKPIGCWVGERKIGQIGIQVRRGITLHGLSLNVNNDLNYFQWIDPCGMPGLKVTSLSKELAKTLDLGPVTQSLRDNLARLILDYPGRASCRGAGPSPLTGASRPQRGSPALASPPAQVEHTVVAIKQPPQS